MTTLCRPREDLGCFRCCPPIRPAGYDHLDYKKELTRQFQENTRLIHSGRLVSKPITGFSCWGLGFLDSGRRLVGCLLHPALNRGQDRRFLTGYEVKCAREICPQAKTYAALDSPLQEAALNLAADGDSFVFSSLRANPLWSLLDWGQAVLSLSFPAWTAGRGELKTFLTSHPSPKARAWLLRGLLTRMEVVEIDLDRFEAEAGRLCANLRPPASSPLTDRPFVHRLGLKPGLAEFLRSGLGLPRLSPTAARELEARIEAALDQLASDMTGRVRG